MGRHDEVRASLASYPAAHDDEPTSRRDRRFVRQLARWLDAGGPSPCRGNAGSTATVAAPSSPGMVGHAGESKAKDEAHDAARAQSRQDPRPAQGTGGRRIQCSRYRHCTFRRAFNAEMLQVEQQPFGRARSALKATRMVKWGGANMTA